jgi:hypothetical protein
MYFTYWFADYVRCVIINSIEILTDCLNCVILNFDFYVL